ncbi:MULTISPECIES: DNA polymerase III subunit beta [Planktothricoides]|uniref:Beta sliding clamp n=2 Tax=Planktothricoides raciborskii TaxID=132608 RepID=A0AAU8JG65_9CYAN|nr:MULTISPECIES: DNA polymerase III subunit beta [Planktothricoides]KOR35827.1 DNA polymerase III subunit beta [Planktothricoides sp. SR001]MBD2544233.1 DNA polymerase III subunit beta [Planktothricoides raciborskii FACHB-1370]MBD2583585.1 DNA polymerase III subunit beta [Planktothricoides raciborskii FACHB-1261]
MKFTCNQSDLHSNLSLVSRAVPSRPSHPILANVLLTADQEHQRVQLTGFDLSLGLCTSFAADIEVGGQLTLPAKLLNDIVSRLPNGEITIDDQTAQAMVTLTSQTGKYQVRGMGAEEFPSLPEIANREAVYLSAEALIEGLRGSLFATSNDETKQVLTGLHIIVQPETLEFAATDGHRLALVETENPNQSEEEPFEVTVPARALRELERMITMRQSQSQDEALSLVVYLDPGQVVFELADQRLTSRTLEGKYPAYRQLIPTQFERQVNVERKQLLAALERIAILASQKNDIVKFTIDSGNQQLSLSVEAQDVGSGQESIAAQVSGGNMEIAFNVKYAMESLKNLGSNEIQIQLNSATSPVVLNPLSGAKMTHLLMPVQLRN